MSAGTVAAAMRFFDHGKPAFENFAERCREIFARERDFATFPRIAHFDNAERELVCAVNQRVARAGLFRRLNEFAELAVLKRVFDAEAGIAQRGNIIQRGGAIFVAEHDCVKIRRVRDLREQRLLFEQIAQRDVAHTETDGGHVRTAEFFHEFVVTSAACERAPLADELKRFENETRVIRKPAHNRKIDAHKRADAERVEQAEKFFPFAETFPRFFRSRARGEKCFERIETFQRDEFANRRQRFRGIERRSRERGAHHFEQPFVRDAFEFVHDGKHFDGGRLVGNAEIFKEKKPQRAVAQPNAKIPVAEPERVQRFDAERDDFRVRGTTRFAENVGVILIKRTQTPALLLFVAIVFADAEPLNRAAKRTRARGNETCERRRHFRTQRNFAPAFVFKIEELRNDFLTGFFGEKLERFERGSVPLGKSETPRRLAPTGKDEVAHGAIFRIKLAKTGK